MNNTNPQVIKKITRSTFRRFGSIYWHVIAGQTVFPVQTSIRFKIPLIIWGAHQGIEQVGMFSYHNEVEMNRRYRKEHDLMGFEAEDLISPNDLIQEKDIYNYIYPSDFKINSIGTRGIYLNNYFRWTNPQQEYVIKKYNYKTANFNRTFDTYDFVDCYNICIYMIT